MAVSVTSLRAQNALEVPVKVDIENGNVDDVLVKVMREGKTFFTQSSVSKMKLKLYFNSTYTIVFSKPGYVTKTIEFDTKAPNDRVADGFDPYKIGVKLFKQYDGVNITVYNQPVGKIKFDKTLDEFNYDTDYSKSILSKLQDAEDKLAEKAKQEKKADKQEPIAKNTDQEAKVVIDSRPGSDVPIATASAPLNKEQESTAVITPANQQDPSPNNAGNYGNDVATKTQGSGGEDTKTLLAMDGSNDIGTGITVSEGNDVGKSNYPAKGNDVAPKFLNGDGADPANGKIAGSNGYDNSPNSFPHDESEKITREDIVEKNKIITIIRVTKGRITTAYRRVNYHWGGPFYFSNDVTSISENIFVQRTGVKD